MKRLLKELVLLLQAKEDVEQLVKEGKLTCSAHPLLIKQLDSIERSMNKNFSKLFTKIDKLEKEELKEEVIEEMLSDEEKKKAENRKIWKERAIGGLVTLIILIIVYLTPL